MHSFTSSFIKYSESPLHAKGCDAFSEELLIWRPTQEGALGSTDERMKTAGHGWEEVTEAAAANCVE